MKKFSPASLCLLSATVFFNSCKKDDSQSGGGTGAPKAGSNSMENIDYMNAEKGIFIYTKEYDDHTNGTPGMFIDFKAEPVSYTS